MVGTFTLCGNDISPSRPYLTHFTTAHLLIRHTRLRKPGGNPGTDGTFPEPFKVEGSSAQYSSRKTDLRGLTESVANGFQVEAVNPGP